MKYAGTIYNDFAAAPGVCLSFFTQGCPFHCVSCHNPQTWDFNGGYEFTEETLNRILNGLIANGIQRTFCIMGGEPLCPENIPLVTYIITKVKEKYPDIKIYIWSGYIYEDLLKLAESNSNLNYILKTADVLIDGPYIESERDITLPMRGSRNQRIINL